MKVKTSAHNSQQKPNLRLKNWLENNWLTGLMLYVPPDTKYVISETFFPANVLA